MSERTAIASFYGLARLLAMPSRFGANYNGSLASSLLGETDMSRD